MSEDHVSVRGVRLPREVAGACEAVLDAVVGLVAAILFVAARPTLARVGIEAGEAPEGDTEGDEFVPLSQARAVTLHPDVWRLPHWTRDGDVQRREWIRTSTEAASDSRRLLRAMMSASDGVTGEELAALAGLRTRSIPTTLRALAMLCRRVGRRPMWEPKRSGGVWHYFVHPEVRVLFGDI